MLVRDRQSAENFFWKKDLSMDDDDGVITIDGTVEETSSPHQLVVRYTCTSSPHQLVVRYTCTSLHCMTERETIAFMSSISDVSRSRSRG